MKIGENGKPAIDVDKIKAAVQQEAANKTKVIEAAAPFQGKKNIYTCEKCFEHIVTVDIDAGVTPFLIDCKCTDGCKGMMKSSMYRVFDQSMKAGWEWYRPADLAGLSPWSKDHVEKGGLILREGSR